MEAFIPINDLTDEILHRTRRHSRHQSNTSIGSIGSVLSMNYDDDASNDAQHPTHTRTSSKWDISQALFLSNSCDTLDESTVEHADADDNREEHTRERHMSAEENIGRERLLSAENLAHNQTEKTSYRTEHAILERPDQVTDCFRAVSCPEMPSFDAEPPIELLSMSDQVELAIRRTRAFSEDGSDYYRRASSGMSDISSGSQRNRPFGNSDSMRIDAAYGRHNEQLDTLQESPTTASMYWEEIRESQSPFATVFNLQF